MKNRIAKFVKLDEKGQAKEQKGWVIHTPDGDVIETDAVLISASQITINGVPQICDKGCCRESLTIVEGDWPDKDLMQHLDRLTENVASIMAERFIQRLLGES